MILTLIPFIRIMLAHPGPVLLLSSISLKLYSPNHEEKFICFSDGMLYVDAVAVQRLYVVGG